MYTAVLFFHLLFIALYLLVLIPRLYYLLAGKDEMMLLFSERSRGTNILLLCLVVLSGIYLGFKYDFSDGLWFSIKLGLLGISAFIGDFAFKNFNRWAGIALILILVYIIALSYTKSYYLIYPVYP